MITSTQNFFIIYLESLYCENERGIVLLLQSADIVIRSAAYLTFYDQRVLIQRNHISRLNLKILSVNSGRLNSLQFYILNINEIYFIGACI